MASGPKHHVQFQAEQHQVNETNFKIKQIVQGHRKSQPQRSKNKIFTKLALTN